MAKYFYMLFIVVVCLAVYASAAPGIFEEIAKIFGKGFGEGLGEGVVEGVIGESDSGDSGGIGIL